MVILLDPMWHAIAQPILPGANVAVEKICDGRSISPLSECQLRLIGEQPTFQTDTLEGSCTPKFGYELGRSVQKVFRLDQLP